MSTGIIFSAVGVLNFLLFLVHRRVFKQYQKARGIWALATIAFPIGSSLAQWEKWLDTDRWGFLGAAVILITGLAMLLVNQWRERRNVIQ